MKSYVLRRLWQAVLVLFGVSVVVFLILHLTGDPAALLLPPDATAEDIARLQGHGLRRSRGRAVPALPEGSVARRLRRVLAPRGACHDARARAAARDLPARGGGPAPGAVPGHPCRHPVRRQA